MRSVVLRPGVLLGLAAGVLLTACSKPSNTPSGTQGVTLAEVGGRKITVEDLGFEAARRARLGRPAIAKEALLQEMVERESLLARVRQVKLDQDPELRREFENLLIARLVDQEVNPRREAVAVSPEQIQAEYETNLDQYTRPAQVRLAMLFLEAGAKASEAHRTEVRSRLEMARNQVAALQTSNRSRGVVGFGPLSIEHSDDQVSRHRGGDLGWIAEGQNPPRIPGAVMEAAWSLEPGAVSPVLESPDGFYLVMKTDSRPSSTASLESVQAALRQTLLVRERKRIEETFRQETIDLAGVQVRSQALAAVTLPPPDALLARGQDPQPPGVPGATLSRNGN